MTARYIVGDTRDVVASLPDGSVDLVLTSPPFLALRSYLPGLLDEWRALWTEAGALQTYTPAAGQFVSSDPARSASLDHALHVLRSQIEDLYATRAAAELLGIPAQLSLFEAAS